MGRALLPTRRVRANQVRLHDVVLVRSDAGSLRWLLVDNVSWTRDDRPRFWSGRWAFGGQRVTVVGQPDAWYTVKHDQDAARDARRLSERTNA